MEKSIKEAVINEQETRTTEGEDFPESDKEFVRKSERFKLMTLAFYGPLELA